MAVVDRGITPAERKDFVAPIDFDSLSMRQRQIVEAVAAIGDATISDIEATIPDPPTPNAIRTMAGHLVHDGVLKRTKRGRAAVYALRSSRAGAAKRALRRLLALFFGGSLERAVTLHLSGDSADIRADELERIEAIVRRARERRDADAEVKS